MGSSRPPKASHRGGGVRSSETVVLKASWAPMIHPGKSCNINMLEPENEGLEDDFSFTNG